MSWLFLIYIYTKYVFFLNLMTDNKKWDEGFFEGGAFEITFYDFLKIWLQNGYILEKYDE